MLFKNWKGNIMGSWSSIFLKMLLLQTLFFINYVKETAFVTLSMHIFVCSRSGRGLWQKLGCKKRFLLLSHEINKKLPEHIYTSIFTTLTI